ncbi:MAG: DnaA/Hda family protein, partial [Acidobacteriota bacterium]
MESLLEKNDIWNGILTLVEQRLNKQVFDSWFRPITFGGCDDTARRLTLKCGQVTKDWVTIYYSDLLDQALEATGRTGYQIEWEIDNSASASQQFADGTDPDMFLEPAQGFAAAALKSSPTGFARSSTTFVDIEPVENSLNPKYTFEKFVVGSSNQFAHAASLAAADTPGKTYNPLFIYGGVGLGKTHLMHAIGHSIKESNRHLRVSYITSEKFMNELINAIRYDKTQSFREKYRSIDVLLMDDVQFMAGKERTQEE